MRHPIAIVIAVAALAGTASASQPARHAPRCGAGSTHAVIAGADRCLRRGLPCSMRYQRQYRRHRFRCVGGRLRETGSGMASPGGSPEGSPPRTAR